MCTSVGGADHISVQGGRLKILANGQSKEEPPFQGSGLFSADGGGEGSTEFDIWKTSGHLMVSQTRSQSNLGLPFPTTRVLTCVLCRALFTT